MTDAPDPRRRHAPQPGPPGAWTGPQGGPTPDPWAVPEAPYPPSPPPWTGHPYPPPYGYPAPPRRFLDGRTLPTDQADYQQLLSGPGRAWWRPLISLLLMFGGLFVGTMAIVLVAVLAGWAIGGADASRWTDDMLAGNMEDPATFVVLNLGIIIFIPVVVLAITVAHRVRPGFIASVTGRFRWGWFGRCLTVLVPLWLLYLFGAWAVDGMEVGARPAQWQVLAILVLLLTPFQSAAEEYAFRGWFLLSLGSWFRHRWVALVVPTVLSVALFGLAHGSFDPWILADLSVFAVAATLLTWRTGGLEAAIAMHAVNNVLAMGFSLAFGGFGAGFIDSSTTGQASQVVVSLIPQAIAVALIWRMADRRGLPWRFEPRRGPVTATYPPGLPMPSAPAGPPGPTTPRPTL